MRSLRISVPGLFRLFVFLAALLLSFQAQAMCNPCGKWDDANGWVLIDDPENDFRRVEVVAAVRYVGQDELDLPKYEIVKYWKSDLKPKEDITNEIIESWKSGLKPGMTITILSTRYCECCAKLPTEGIVIAYLGSRRSTDRIVLTRKPAGLLFFAVGCIRHFHESEEGYAEKMRWLDERVKQPSR